MSWKKLHDSNGESEINSLFLNFFAPFQECYFWKSSETSKQILKSIQTIKNDETLKEIRSGHGEEVPLSSPLPTATGLNGRRALDLGQDALRPAAPEGREAVAVDAQRCGERAVKLRRYCRQLAARMAHDLWLV